MQRRALLRQEEDVDPEARFRAVFDVAYAPLCRYARHRGLTGPDAEDLVAQTLEIAWRRIDDLPSAEPLPWLYAVARNLPAAARLPAGPAAAPSRAGPAAGSCWPSCRRWPAQRPPRSW